MYYKDIFPAEFQLNLTTFVSWQVLGLGYVKCWLLKSCQNLIPGWLLTMSDSYLRPGGPLSQIGAKSDNFYRLTCCGSSSQHLIT